MPFKSDKGRTFLFCEDIECFLEHIHYKESGFSDHKMLLWKIYFIIEKRGPGVWILKSGLLNNEN